MPHQIEATKMINALLLRGGANQRHHVVYMSLGDDPGHILRINQHDVGASRLKTRQSLAQPRCLRLHSRWLHAAMGFDIADEVFLDEKPQDALAFRYVEGIRRRPKSSEERGQRFSEAQVG